MKNITLVFLLLVGLYSCSSDSNERAKMKDLISQEYDSNNEVVFDHVSIKFPGKPIIDTTKKGNFTVYFAYYVYDDGYDTIVYSAQYLKFPQLTRTPNCFKKIDCIQKYYDKGIEGGLNYGKFKLLKRSNIEMNDHYS